MPRLILLLVIVSFTTLCYATISPDKANCTKPPKIENAFLIGDMEEETYPQGHKVIYGCHPGYLSFYKIQMLCLDGKWRMLRDLQCRKKPCGHPGDIPFGSFQLINGDQFVFGAVVEYSCDDGYQMVTKHKTRICSASGWINQLPQCEERLCPPVRDDRLRVLSSVYDEEFTMGHVINFACKNPRHILKGPHRLYCTADGTWDRDPPTCEASGSCTVQENEVKRNNIQLKNNGILHYEDKEEIQFECVSGYEISDLAKLIIQCNSGILKYPICQKKGSCIVEENDMRINNIQLKNNGSFHYEDKDEVQTECVTGYEISDSRKLIIHCNNGILKFPSCHKKVHKIPCGRPPHTAHGEIIETIKDSYSSGSTVTYKCLQTFKLQGRNTIKCQDGIWDEPPLCVVHKIPCGRPPHTAHGEIIETIKDSYSSGSTVTYKCLQTFKHQGRKKIKCQNGIWDEPPLCVEDTPCGKPPHILYGDITTTIKDRYSSGSTVKYKCPQFYNLKGSGVIKCRKGIWTEPPLCLEPCTTSQKNMSENNITLSLNQNRNKECDQKEQQIVKCYLKHNETIWFACLPGYKISDPKELKSKCDRGILTYPRCFNRQLERNTN
ncbi:hypothetical protein GDO81_017935 [Engystomops pustulosus]|uniref:Sushi domain-containing protein n=1 Tax=Engystomops pustulosus TaxID=76066 RepID=A0AAV7A9L5_ENGPU|nr:hypothetical protein GDO81_017935 [Engystomops pustulosus]